VAIGKIFLYQEQELELNYEKISDSDAEVERLLKGQSETKVQLEAIREKTRAKLGDEKAAIFDGHITLLEDEDLVEEVKMKIEDDRKSAELALHEGIEEYCEMIANLDDEYLRERVADLRDIAKRWMNNILGVEVVDLGNLPENTVIIARDLTPSDTAQMDLENVQGFVTEIGGRTAHSAIMARSLEVPAVVGTKEIMSTLVNGQLVAVDALTGDVIINPSEEEIKKYTEKRDNYLNEKEELRKLSQKEAITTDGRKVDTWANIGSPNDLDGVIRNGADGVGLYRTEFLFMNNDRLPSEDEQFAAYREVAERMEGKPVTIRTMDIGGDKALPYMKLPHEDNPFLGYRALRVCLDRVDMFKTQLRALLKASAHGQVKIMFPMVISLSEVRAAKKLLEECKDELRLEGIAFDEKVKVGIMIETPATAFRARQFAEEVDFFSIGTNDLTQYTLAVDRGNENISELYDTYNPAVLQAIKFAIDGAHEAGITISMCGEFAGDEAATELLLGLGLDAYSMSAISIPKIKRNLIKSSYADSKLLADEALKLDTAAEIKLKIKK
jgi:phosphotransferase system enzyme I (PtsI)